MNLRFFYEIIISFLLVIKIESQIRLKNSNERVEEKRFIKCLEGNSLTSCLILLFINEKQEKLLLQVQNELSK